MSQYNLKSMNDASMATALIFHTNVRSMGYYRDLSKKFALEAKKGSRAVKKQSSVAGIKAYAIKRVKRVFAEDLIVADKVLDSKLSNSVNNSLQLTGTNRVALDFDWPRMVCDQAYRAQQLASIGENDSTIDPASTLIVGTLRTELTEIDAIARRLRNNFTLDMKKKPR